MYYVNLVCRLPPKVPILHYKTTRPMLMVVRIHSQDVLIPHPLPTQLYVFILYMCFIYGWCVH